MKIAIVGAGFLGLACTWHLLQNPRGSVTLFDAKGIGQGASGIAAGLLHPFAGAKGTRNWMAEIAYPEATRLLQIASQSLKAPVYKHSGIFRPAVTALQRENFYKTATRYPDCYWCDEPKSALFPHPGLFISSGIQVDSPAYLQGLWKAAQEKGAELVTEKISSPSALNEFDLVVFTVGVGFLELPELAVPAMSAVKGQLLELAWDDTLEYGVSCQAYLAQNSAGTLVAGATYEHSWDTIGPDRASCEQELRAKLADFSPELAKLPLQNVKAGFRAVTQDKKPFIVKTGPNCYCLGGLGSKGLLYHAWLAKELANQVSPLR